MYACTRINSDTIIESPQLLCVCYSNEVNLAHTHTWIICLKCWLLTQTVHFECTNSNSHFEFRNLSILQPCTVRLLHMIFKLNLNYGKPDETQWNSNPVWWFECMNISWFDIHSNTNEMEMEIEIEIQMKNAFRLEFEFGFDLILVKPTQWLFYFQFKLVPLNQ